MKLIERAWKIYADDLDEPWHVPDEVFYGKTRGKAKVQAWASIAYDGFKNTMGEETTFLNLKLSRCKKMDRYLVGDKIFTLDEIEYRKKEDKRNEALDVLAAANPEGKAYIMRKGYFYRPNNCGYTERRTQAGVYSIQEAVQEVKGCSLHDDMDVIPIDVNEHNQRINKEIESLQSRLIK